MSDLKPQSSTESEYEVFEKGERALREEAILAFWDEQQIFKKTLEKEAPKGEFVFYDGPPFATGLPHYGHLLPGTMKDLIPRYKTMQGYHVSRTWGWDCHGLPIENLIEKELNLATKKDIEAYGIDRFNEAARASVLRYDAQWKEIIPRMGRFVDMEHAYKSMDTNYTESVWWSFKNLFEKKLVYEDFKSMHLCPRCETTLANFEVNQGYKDITDISVVAKFELLDEPGTYVLAWTTTPWTLPGNVALAVGADIEYVQVQDTSEEGTAQYILAKHIFETDEELKKNFKSNTVSVVAEMKGSDLVGKKYRPVFDYFSNDETVDHRENGWCIYAASFVTVDDGTGVVHIAPAFGDDDMQLGREYTLPFIQHVQKDGHMVSAITDFAGMMVKPKDDHQATDIEVIKWLAHNHKLFAKKKYIHSYPHCWRCDTPLLNYATTSWFLNIHKIKDRLLAHNATISWTPEHIRDGRFGKWLEGARDWALSRSRYWGAVLPVWKRKDGTGMVVIGSLEELQQYTKKSGNTYLVMRHGESESNVHGTVATTDWASPYPLTAKGREQVMEAVAQLKNEHIDLILCSPFIRARETAQIIAEALSLPTDNMVVEGLRERYVDPLYEGKTWSEVHTAVAELDNWYVDQLGEGESIEQVKIRATQLLYSLENNYQGKKILIITHGGVIDGMRIGVEGQSRERVYVQDEMKGRTRTNHGEIYPLSFIPLPHNERYELDLHRPYIDRLELVDTDGEPLELIKEVFDVWYESGSMPYASLHYPFENKELFDQTRFPADFIAEGLDQTRGWFYVLHVLATALFDKPAFKNVIVNGMVLAEDGKKMSKRLKNYPPIEKVANVYGADALRLFLMTSPAVRAEDVNLAEKSIAEVSQKVIGRLLNVMNMYELYATHEHAPERAVSPHALDQWILARLDQITREVTEQLDIYALDKAGRAFFDFVDDLSTWYIRRSRERFKGDDAEDKAYALATTRYVMRQLALLMAPFTPFVADELWQKIKGEDDVESVHLASWPQNHVVNTSAEQILTNMQLTRDIVSSALELRNTAAIKVRQPLARLTIATNLDEQYLELIKDEVNVKEVLAGNELELDTTLTPELRAEGVVRDVLRQVQAMRKDAGLNPEDRITLTIDTDQKGKELLEGAHSLFASVAGVEQMHFASCEGERVVVDDYTFTLQVKKL